MPELRVIITDKMNELLEDLVETGLFTSKADLVRHASIAYLHDLGLVKKPE